MQYRYNKNAYVRLDEETEQQLRDILAREKDTNRSELIKRLIRERWLTLQAGRTLVKAIARGKSFSQKSLAAREKPINQRLCPD
ncbi:hypothetical protein [Gloeocapsopsis dulcis]|uniref:hypothetical protein n=1 Tax=Gloeocapsopsis dulcis TaxID=2859516 RepID=UPI002B25EA41|nr:hypothetical protein [Gloeocapsopsis dulcis]WNN90205.1 hypothetical protein P0S91_03645 [Gloeocapsopsis dulcis]